MFFLFLFSINFGAPLSFAPSFIFLWRISNYLHMHNIENGLLNAIQSSAYCRFCICSVSVCIWSLDGVFVHMCLHLCLCVRCGVVFIYLQERMSALKKRHTYIFNYDVHPNEKDFLCQFCCCRSLFFVSYVFFLSLIILAMVFLFLSYSLLNGCCMWLWLLHCDYYSCSSNI